MNCSSLSDFVNQAKRSNRITFGDVKRLTRDILAGGISEREEVEALITLDRAITKTDPSWADFLVNSIVDFVVWGDRPTGYVEFEAAQWLLKLLSSAGWTKTTRRIAREVTQEAQEVDNSLLSFVADHAGPRFPNIAMAPFMGQQLSA